MTEGTEPLSLEQVESAIEVDRNIRHGQNSSYVQKVKGIIRGNQQTEARKPVWTEYQAAADKVWKKHPTWGTPAVAKQISSQFPGTAEDTIRKRIKKPIP